MPWGHNIILIDKLKSTTDRVAYAQLSFYMTAIDRQVKSKADGKTIGLVLCKSRNDLIVEYALSDVRRPIGVSTYQLGLPSPEQLQAKLQKLLACPRIAKKSKASPKRR